MKVESNAQRLTEIQKDERLEYLMRRFGNKVLKLAYYHVRDRYQAEDIGQEVFYRVYQNLDKFRHDSAYYTWIYRITVNLCRDYLRSAYFRRLLPWGNIKQLDSMRNTTNRLFEAVEGGEVFQKVMDLPVKYRIIISLYYLEGLSTTEIAGILKLREGTVRTRLCRAREMLKDMLSEEEDIYA
ncbi:MAG: polymerase sigma-70 factor, subfamily [Clostridiales bacterium]|jgi:RNA polymerase sigma-70 factor (ECF subfamily)|nr:polymerase sigma-70 factor, subfamily [Clostridiales bacterium]MDK2933301.1 polymerase sigma-70 factor, subfamily [Clostridiales bacterium]